jgi:hypothetical protein
MSGTRTFTWHNNVGKSIVRDAQDFIPRYLLAVSVIACYLPAQAKAGCPGLPAIQLGWK